MSNFVTKRKVSPRILSALKIVQKVYQLHCRRVCNDVAFKAMALWSKEKLFCTRGSVKPCIMLWMANWRCTLCNYGVKMNGKGTNLRDAIFAEATWTQIWEYPISRESMNELKIILPLPKAKLDHYPARNFFLIFGVTWNCMPDWDFFVSSINCLIILFPSLNWKKDGELALKAKLWYFVSDAFLITEVQGNPKSIITEVTFYNIQVVCL